VSTARIEFIPRGRGVVECEVWSDGELIGALFGLQYPTQGQMIGAPPVDVVNAKRLS
jgi:hypothetical protein